MENNELYHHGVLGQKWGVRRYQNKDGTLTAVGQKQKKLYRSKLATADDHYKRAIKNYEKSTDLANRKRDRKTYEAMAVYQYGQAQKYTKTAAKIARKFSSKNGTAVQPSQSQLDRKNKAAALFVKKVAARRVAECTANVISVGAQFVAQTVLIGRPVTAISTQYSAYKIKRH